MKYTLITIVLLLLSINLSAQINLKAEYIGQSNYKKSEGGKASTFVSSIDAAIPFSMKKDKEGAPIVWAATLNTKLTSFNTKNISHDLISSEILNTSLGVMHMRPFKNGWSIVAGFGVGAYTSHAHLEKVKMTNVVFNGFATIIKKKKNIKYGLGAFVTSLYGYPMVFILPYFEWELKDRFDVSMKFVGQFEVSAGMKVSDKFRLSVVNAVSGSMGLEKVDGRRKMLSHRYMVFGVQPEFTFGRVSIPVRVGATFLHKARYKRRILPELFKSKKNDFNTAPYVSVGLNFNLQ